MASSGAVQVKLELGHRAQVRKKPTVEGFTHDWMVFVRGAERSNIQHFVEKVVFHLHESFPRPKRVCKDPPYKVEESGYAGFILPIEVYFKNKQRDPHKRSTEDSKVMVMQEGSTSLFGQHLKLPTLPSSSLTLTFSDAKKSKSSLGSKVGGDSQDGSRSSSSSLSTANANSGGGGGSSKLHKPKDHKDRTAKDSKEHKSAFKDSARDPGKPSKDSSKKPKENQPARDERSIPKMGFKEPKALSKEHKSEGPVNHGAGAGPGGSKAPGKRPPVGDGEEHVTKKRKKGFPEAPAKPASGPASSPPHHHSDKKTTRDRPPIRPAKLKVDSEPAAGRKPPALPPLRDLVVDSNDSDAEDNMSNKSESEQPSPASSTSSSSSGFAPSHKHHSNDRQVPDFVCRKVVAVPTTAHTVLGPLRSIIQDLHSEDNEEESEDDDDNEADSDLERPLHTHLSHRHRRVSLSDGSDSENSSASSPPPRNDPPPPLLKTSNNQILEVKSPIKQLKQEKSMKNIDCDKAYLDELVELHRRLMALRERHILQQIVNLIEETGHFHITNTTFDFDLCSLDKTTVRKLQSYLETSGTS
ncbi:protein AF-9 isoform X4 [Anguilla anguilla]|uniref:protein AF-9 isoform X4 n=1 Tax=Anguilla anguilla TaxID=7936 RepID=UPI0015AA87BB|nr:protein AF-9 isoform X4 [Anguilla anguilla]